MPITLRAEKTPVAPPTINSSRMRLPDSALAPRASPLLGAAATGAWQEVPGALPVAPWGAADASDAEDQQPRIIDGDADATGALFPYATFLEWALGYDMQAVGNGTGRAVSICTASLVAPGYLLTAAHVSSRAVGRGGSGLSCPLCCIAAGLLVAARPPACLSSTSTA